jgi:hypothetical protein
VIRSVLGCNSCLWGLPGFGGSVVVLVVVAGVGVVVGLPPQQPEVKDRVLLSGSVSI